VDDALNVLKFTHKAGSKPVEKVIRSAVANATQKGDVDVDNLIIKKAFVDDGPTMKRFRPAPMGRAMEVRKRTSHITIQLSEE
jgi:large subunit ribosomal protein L22